MNDNQERIAAKIKKILAIAGDDAASDAEIQNAMQHAQRLMDSHHITEADLAHEPKDDYQKVDTADFDRYRSFLDSKRVYAWESHLAMFISEFVGAPCYIDNQLRPVRKGGLTQTDDKGNAKIAKSIVFFGVVEDATIAAEVYGELRTLIATMAVGRWGSYCRGEGASYAQGFVSGLRTRYSKARIEQQQTGGNNALVLARRDDLIAYKKDKSRDWLAKSEGVKLRKGSGQPGSRVGFNAQAHREGIQDGKATDVHATRRRKLN